ncbi:unnamed protein product [Symbiodinium sp. CCMP2456]|nr:unnamed protein product [Symbiodinium sp. CCMP2456]
MFRGGKVDNYFKVSQRGSNLTTEIRAGITTFLTAAYIMAVNPNILSTTGLKFEGLVFATAGSSCIALLGRLQDRIVDSAFESGKLRGSPGGDAHDVWLG